VAGPAALAGRPGQPDASQIWDTIMPKTKPAEGDS